MKHIVTEGWVMVAGRWTRAEKHIMDYERWGGTDVKVYRKRGEKLVVCKPYVAKTFIPIPEESFGAMITEEMNRATDA